MEDECTFFQEADLILRIQELNMHIVCGLCAGYFIDATTISECSHTFCKSCIVKHLQTKKSCPECGQKIHETQPLLNLRSDRVMQDVVYKLVPNLFQNEQQREAEFCRSRGTDFALSKSHLLNIGTPLKYTQKKVIRDTGEQPILDVYVTKLHDLNLSHRHAFDEICTIRLQSEIHPATNCKQPLLEKYIQCPSRATVKHLCFVIKTLLNFDPDIHISLTCCGKKLHHICTLKQVILLNWKITHSVRYPTIKFHVVQI